MIRFIICLALVLPLTAHAAPERPGRGEQGGARADQAQGMSKVRRKTPSVRAMPKTQRPTLNVRSKSPAARGTPSARRPARDSAHAPQSTRRPTTRQPAARSPRAAPRRTVHRDSRRGYRAPAHRGYRSPGRVYVSSRRGPRHPGWSRRHFRVSHHTPLTIVIERSALQSRLGAARRDLVQVEYAIAGLALAHVRHALMQHVHAIRFALDDIDSALIHARPYASYRRGWVILDQNRFWQRMRNAESALAQLDDEVAGLQDAQSWSGHARLGQLDTNLDALSDSLVDADAYDAPSASAPVEAPVSAGEYARLDRALHAATFRDEKFDLVRRAVQTQYFTTAQARGIARQIHADNDKVTVLTWLYPRLVDPERFDAVMSDLPEDADRRRLRANVYGM